MIEPERHDGPLPEDLARSVERLAGLAAASDGVAPLDEDAELGLRLAHHPERVHLVVRRQAGNPPDPGNPPDTGEPPGPGDLTTTGDLTGYAQVAPDSGAITLVVAPGHRRRKLGSTLLAHATDTLPAGTTPSGWAHGDLPAAAGFAARHGFSPTRTLLQLRRSLDTPLPAAGLAPGYRLRPFVPGQDDAAWLALNAAAFAGYPDQGGLGQTDLEARMAEPWFDPAGLLLAEADDGSLAASHWTKIHERTEDDPSPSGEVYVVAVDPGRQGQGLGRAVLTAGLEHLRARGMRRVLLYVDAANAPAVALYKRLGFTIWRTDTRYAP